MLKQKGGGENSLFFSCLSRNALLPGSWFYTPWAFCFLLLLLKKKGRTRREVFLKTQKVEQKKSYAKAPSESMKKVIKRDVILIFWLIKNQEKKIREVKTAERVPVACLQSKPLSFFGPPLLLFVMQRKGKLKQKGGGGGPLFFYFFFIKKIKKKV